MFDLYIHSSAKSGSDSHGTNKSNIQLGLDVSAETAFDEVATENVKSDHFEN